jgi:O-antigen ligase
VGGILLLKERGLPLKLFHVTAIFSVFTCLMSATVSQHSEVALLKATGVLFLFVYAATGARLAFARSELSFLHGLRRGSEVLVAAVGIMYGLGFQVLGNPNSLGAVMCLLAPVLLWGLLIDQGSYFRPLHLLFFFLCVSLLVYSRARAGLLAAACSCALLCVGLRRYRLLVTSLITVVILTAGVSLVQPEFLSSFGGQLVYKRQDQGQGFWSSRESPWGRSIEMIERHPWFGMGIGTTSENSATVEGAILFSSSNGVNTENGSSYLSVLLGVGILGAVPILLLLLILIANLGKTFIFMWRSRSLFSAVPFAVVIVSGLIHAAFEDWLLAPGNYLCAFFWICAFIFMDVNSKLPTAIALRANTPIGLLPHPAHKIWPSHDLKV